MKELFKLYIDAYRGLSTPSWMLALVMLINRSGAMVIPFLGLYMTNKLHFSFENTGIVLGCFGAGAIGGSLMGGWFTDRIGDFKVQLICLLLTIPIFISLPQLHTVWSLAIGVFVLSLISETFRPANSVSVASYATQENVVRSFSLNRMAMNLGFSIGPALGGFLAAISYALLFYGNAVAALLSAVLFYVYFKNRRPPKAEYRPHEEQPISLIKDQSPYRDLPFMLFSVLCSLYAVCFLQFLNTIPLYYKTIYQLSEYQIGIILAFSGVVVFSLEMLLVHLAERRMSVRSTLVLGTLLGSISFMVLNLLQGVPVLYASMFLLCISEILLLPFMATVAMKRSSVGKRGAYMAVNALSFSVAHVVSPLIGTTIASQFGFATLWWSTAVVLIATALGFYLIMKKLS